MADNIAFTPGVGATGAADEIGSVYYPRVKLSLGADGTAVDAVAGAGAVSTGVQRVTLASDDPAVAQITLAAASLSVLDDMDESDRMKVNIIAGQAGVAAGAGAVGATVPRVTLASDDPGVAQLTLAAASLSVVDDWDETDRCKVNVIAGQVGVTGGAGAVAANTPRVTHASDDPAVTSLATIVTKTTMTARDTEGDYETVAASQTAQVLGATGAAGDYIAHLIVIPATTSPGAIALLDNVTSVTVFTGGASSVADLKPFAIPLRMISATGAWKVTTGANVSCIGVGSFT